MNKMRTSIHKNTYRHSAFSITIKNAKDGGDIRIGIDEGDNFGNLISFIRANNNDFDDLQNLSPYTPGFILLNYNGEIFTEDDFIRYQLLSRTQPQNIDVILFGKRSLIQVDFKGTIYDILGPPTFYYIQNNMLDTLELWRLNLVQDHINLEVIDGDLITSPDMFTGQPSIYINKPIGRTRKVRLSILNDKAVKDIFLGREIPGITIQPIQSIQDVKDNTDQLSGLKLVIDCNHYNNIRGSGKGNTLFYGIWKGWFDVVQLIENGEWFDDTFCYILERCTKSLIKKIILSVDILSCLADISQFLEKTTIPMITIQSPNQLKEDGLRLIEDAISRNENITHFSGLESDHIRHHVRGNLERKIAINRVKVLGNAGPGVKKNIIGFT